MHFNCCPISLALIALSWAHGTLGQSSQEASPKPSSCEGVMMVHAEIPDITATSGKRLDQFVGNLTYSLAMNGTLSLTSTVPTWHCSPIETRSNSTSTMRTVHTMYASAQLACYSDEQPVEASWLTQWTSLKFSGQVYVSIMAHDGTCASPPELLGAGSSCTYNATSDGGLRSTSTCGWTSKDDVHHLGDQQKDGGGGNSEE